eukprot:1305224-Rhodomonas_salina.1
MQNSQAGSNPHRLSSPHAPRFISLNGPNGWTNTYAERSQTDHNQSATSLIPPPLSAHATPRKNLTIIGSIEALQAEKNHRIDQAGEEERRRGGGESKLPASAMDKLWQVFSPRRLLCDPRY